MDYSFLNMAATRLCLNTANRVDRWYNAEFELGTCGIKADRFIALPGRDPFNSFNKSQHEMIKAGNVAKGILAAFEDDVLFVNPIDGPNLDEVCYAALRELPPNWDIVYLGCNITEEKPEYYSAHLCRLRSAWMTHAVLYNVSVLDFIEKNFNPDDNHMYDDWLSREVLPKFNCFVVNPMVAWQRTGKSELWGRDTDYWPAYYEGNNKMQP